MLGRVGNRSKTSNRVDDNVDSIRNRLRTFAEENSKVEKHIQQSGRFWKIEASGDVEAVYSSIKPVVGDIIR
ncbi:Adenylate kinase isoenzyme 1 [Sarracenia purpurea var. burkii]